MASSQNPHVYLENLEALKIKVANLIKCGIDRWRAYQWGNTRKGYWRIVDNVVLKRAIPNTSLKLAGYPV